MSNRVSNRPPLLTLRRAMARVVRSEHPPADEDLERAIHDIGYELTWMAVYSAARIGRGKEHEGIAPAILESYLLHVRNVDDFLRGVRSKHTAADDVLASDYLPGAAPRCHWHLLTEADRERINGELHHLTTRRRRGKTWDRDERFAIRALGDPRRPGYRGLVGEFVALLCEHDSPWHEPFDGALENARGELSDSLAERYTFGRLPGGGGVRRNVTSAPPAVVTNTATSFPRAT